MSCQDRAPVACTWGLGNPPSNFGRSSRWGAVKHVFRVLYANGPELRPVEVRFAHGFATWWCGNARASTSRALYDRAGFGEMYPSESQIQIMIDPIPALAWSCLP